MRKSFTSKRYLIWFIAIGIILLGIIAFPEAFGRIIAIIIVFAIMIGIPYLLFAYLEKKRNKKAKNKEARAQGFKNAEEKDIFIKDEILTDKIDGC